MAPVGALFNRSTPNCAAIVAAWFMGARAGASLFDLSDVSGGTCT